MLPGPSSSSTSEATSFGKDRYQIDNKYLAASNVKLSSQSTAAASPSPGDRHRSLRRGRYNPWTNHGISEHSDELRHEKQPPVMKQSSLSPTRSFLSYKKDETDEDDLQEVAQRIRAELCYTEILELAVEAERAAEAGQEYFVGQPSTFSDGDYSSINMLQGAASPGGHRDDSSLPTHRRLLRPHLTMRAKTFAGLNRMHPLQSNSALAAAEERLKRKKVNVLTLRPAADVFPSFDSFHDHIRTHLRRNQVDGETLLYYPHGPFGTQKTFEPSQSVLHNGLDALSQSFSFDRWGHSSSLSSHDGEADYANTLADHLTRESKKHSSLNKRHNLRKVQPLPDLDIHALYSLTRSASSRSDQTSPQALLDFSQDEDDSGNDGMPQSGSESAPFMPHTPQPLISKGNELYQFRKAGAAVFGSETVRIRQADDDPLYSPGNSIEENDAIDFRTPTTTKHVLEAGPSFITPARLRDIRGQESMIPSNDLVGDPQPSSTNCKPPFLSPLIHDDGYNFAQDIVAERNTVQVKESLLLPPSFPGRILNHRTETASVSKVRTGPNQTSHLSACGPSRQYSIASESNSILHDSNMNPEECSQEATPDSPVTADCSCLSLSPVGSSIEGSSLTGPWSKTLGMKLALPDTSETAKPKNLLRRSSSAGAILDEQWGNSVSMYSCQDVDSKKNPKSAVQRILSRFSPIRSSKALRFSSKENDEFLHNYLYCRKVTDSKTDQPPTTQNKSAGCDANSWLCAPFFPDSDFGEFFGNPQVKSANKNGLSLGLDSWSKARLEPESWFDLANEHLDGVLTQFAGQAARKDHDWNMAFEAPILKKSSFPRRSARTSVSVDVAQNEWREEKKSDEMSQLDVGRSCDNSVSQKEGYSDRLGQLEVHTLP